jgi:hypothetical protein
MDNQLSCCNCCTDRFTDRRSIMFCRCQLMTWRHASRRTRAPSAWIIPDSSAMGMNSFGPMIPRSGSRHLNSASTPHARPLAISICG